MILYVLLRQLPAQVLELVQCALERDEAGLPRQGLAEDA